MAHEEQQLDPALRVPTRPGGSRARRPWRRWVVRAVGLLLIAAGATGQLASPGWPQSWGRPPLGRITALDLDAAGNVYLSDADYTRVQVYGGDGTPVRVIWSPIRPNWLDVSDDGRIRVWDGDLQVAVADAATEALIVVAGTASPGDVPPPRSQAVAPDGTLYRLEPYAAGHLAQLYPRVVRVSPAGERRVIIRDPLRRWLVRWPFPAAYYAMAGVCLLLVHALRRRRDAPAVAA